MAGIRQDYLLRQLELLRQFVARLMSRRSDRELEEALLLSFHLQEKLFPVPPADFLRLELADQIAALRQNESPTSAHEKVLTYASLLAETAGLYELKGRGDLADGSRQMALYAALCASLEHRGDEAATGLIEKLTGQLDPEQLHAPVAELLAELRREP
ncbi:MAG: hypothetical protein QG602_3565 [Verrucomicrobiota bacterium]|nr:hypothetical protein [Verrucomicrobiota bacterium]